MRTSHQLFPLFRSELVARILGRLLIGGGEEKMGDLASRFSVTPAAVTAAVRHLQNAGAVSVRVQGNTKFVHADATSPVHEPLRQLCLVVAGPPVLLAEELAEVPGVEEAYIFGSWAAREAGVPGLPPGDVDVLVVGHPKLADVTDACVRVEALVGRDINPLVVSPTRWIEDPDAFLRGLRQGPLLRLDIPAGEQGEEHDGPQHDLPPRGDHDQPHAEDWTAGLVLG